MAESVGLFFAFIFSFALALFLRSHIVTPNFLQPADVLLLNNPYACPATGGGRTFVRLDVYSRPIFARE